MKKIRVIIDGIESFVKADKMEIFNFHGNVYEDRVIFYQHTAEKTPSLRWERMSK